MRKIYRDTTRRRNTRLGEKYRIHGKISTLNRTWNNRKLEEEEAKTLLGAVGKTTTDQYGNTKENCDTTR